ncbi:MAG TPA: ACT domain-containing protein [Acidimicrobiales bacterium]|jgi:glycine cleavage system transcriptional repressor|nr:ACT domain-containing protein [Acidimicrobiales bacterium]
MARVAVTAFGVDRPGMVAAVTGVLMDHGGNIEDSAMTILGGHFAMMLVVHIPDDQPVAGLEAELAAGVSELGLTVAVRPVADGDPGPTGEAAGPDQGTPEPPIWSVSVHGADRPGIVYHVTRLLADHGANVVDLSTRVIGTPDQPAYVLLVRVGLGPGTDQAALSAGLEDLAAELGVEVHTRPDDADIL